TANRPWPTSVAPCGGESRSGSAWLGRSQKDGLPSCRAGGDISFAVQGHRLALEGQPSRCPFLIGGGAWAPRWGSLFCSPVTSTSYCLIVADTTRVMFSDMSPDLSCTH